MRMFFRKVSGPECFSLHDTCSSRKPWKARYVIVSNERMQPSKTISTSEQIYNAALGLKQNACCTHLAGGRVELVHVALGLPQVHQHKSGGSQNGCNRASEHHDAVRSCRSRISLSLKRWQEGLLAVCLNGALVYTHTHAARCLKSRPLGLLENQNTSNHDLERFR